MDWGLNDPTSDIIMASTLDTILTGANATYIAELYARYLTQPGCVDPSWATVFVDLDDDSKEVLD